MKREIHIDIDGTKHIRTHLGEEYKQLALPNFWVIKEAVVPSVITYTPEEIEELFETGPGDHWTVKAWG